MDTDRIPKQALQYIPKEEATWNDRGRNGGTTSSGGLRNMITRLNLHEHYNDGDDNDSSALDS
jgi:hypothetical protein